MATTEEEPKVVEAKAEESPAAAEATNEEAGKAPAAGGDDDDNKEKTEEALPAKQEEKAAAEPPSEEVMAAPKERLQFFFSDANVRHDNFMRKLLMSREQAVPVDDLLRFNTIKAHTTEPSVVVQAAKQLADTLTVVDNDKAIGRVKPFTRDLMDGHLPVTLLVRNLPYAKQDDGKTRYTVTVDTVKALFESYGELALVKFRFGHASAPNADLVPPPRGRLPRGPRLPVGSAFIEFTTKEACDKAAAETLTHKDGADVEAKRPLTVGEGDDAHTLSVVRLQEYVDKLRSESNKKRKANDEASDDNDDKQDEEEELPTFTMEWKKNCVIKLEGLAESCDREKMLEAVAKGMDKDVQEVKDMRVYVDFSRGQTDGCIRFMDPAQVPDVLAKLKSGELHVAGAAVPTVCLLEGQEEEQYWQDFMDFKTKQMRQRHEEKKARRKKHRRH